LPNPDAQLRWERQVESVRHCRLDYDSWRGLLRGILSGKLRLQKPGSDFRKRKDSKQGKYWKLTLTCWSTNQLKLSM
jgi:hypothetical protein